MSDKNAWEKIDGKKKLEQPELVTVMAKGTSSQMDQSDVRRHGTKNVR